jgi:hypothetical protein
MESVAKKNNLKPDPMDAMTWQQRFWCTWNALVVMEGDLERLIGRMAPKAILDPELQELLRQIKRRTEGSERRNG